MDDLKQLRQLAGLNEATLNISMTGTDSNEINDLMRLFKDEPMAKVTPLVKPPIGLGPKPLPPAPMSLDGPLPPLPPPKPLGPIGMDDGPSPCSTCGGIHGDEPCGESTEWDNAPDEKYQDEDYMTNDLSGGINRSKDYKAIRVKDPQAMESEIRNDLHKKLQEKYFTEFDGRAEGKNEIYPKEEQSFSGRSDRTYFVVPNEEDYMDIQDDSRFAGDIEVPDENADIMALPNSKARKLKMMYGKKVEFLGTDYDEAVAQMGQEEGYQRTNEKPLRGNQHKLPPHIKDEIEKAEESSAADKAFADMDAELGKADDHGLGAMSQQMKNKAQAKRDKGTIPKNPNRAAQQRRAADDAFADMDREMKSMNSSMYAEDMNRILQLSGLPKKKR